MTSRNTATLLALAAGLAITGCAKKPPKELPPPPPSSTSPSAATNPTPPVGNGILPGSRADFVQKAGSDTIHFATDSIDLDADSRATLDAQAQWLQQYASVRATIEGHCDERGTREYRQVAFGRSATARSARSRWARTRPAGRRTAAR